MKEWEKGGGGKGGGQNFSLKRTGRGGYSEKDYG